MLSKFTDSEKVVLGTLLSDGESKGFFRKCRGALKKEMFLDKQNAFVFSIIEDMHKQGKASTYPYDVFQFAEKNGIKYGNAQKFCLFMVTLSNECYDEDMFLKCVRELVKRRVEVLKRNGKL